MKRPLALAFALALAFCAQAQKYASVNTDYIFAAIPDYGQVETQLARLSAQWQEEIATRAAEIERLYKTYQQEAYLLPDNLKRKREEDLAAKERDLKELQRQHFGAGGDLDQKRAELLRPIQERVYGAIERIANEKGYAFVFDRAGSNTVLFASSKYDLSDQVLDLLGYSARPADGASPSGGDAPSPRKGASNSEMKSPSDRSPKSGNSPRNVQSPSAAAVSVPK